MSLAINKRRIIRYAKLILLVALLMPQPVLAQNLPGIDFSANDINYYDPRGNSVCGTASTTNQAINPSQAQEANTKIILGIVKSEKLDQKAALVALMTALQESNITNLANSSVPASLNNPNKQGTGSDHDSVGVFQQRPSTGWSTFGSGLDQQIVWQLMDVAYAAEAFLGTPPGATLPSNLANPSALKKGLQNVDNWQSLPPGVVAQKVQVSAFPDAYAKHQDQAQKLIDQYWNQASLVPLPIPLTGGTAGGTANSGGCAATGELSGLLNTIRKYAWPEYHEAPYLVMKPEYQAAVAAAQLAGVYVGGAQYPGIDCGGFVTLTMRNSGTDPTYNDQKGNVVGQKAYLDSHPDKFQKINGATTTKDLRAGDIFIANDLGHTYIFVGNVPNFGGNSASASLGPVTWRTPMASNAYDISSSYWYWPIKLSSNSPGA